MDACADALLALSVVAATDGDAEALLESHELLPRLVQFQCPRCLYLTAEAALIDTRRRCPHCKRCGERRLFPPPSLLSICDLVRAAYAAAVRQGGDRCRGFAGAFGRRFGCALSDAALLALARRVQAAAGGTVDGLLPSAMLEEVGQTLGIADEKEAQAAYGQLLLFSDSAPAGFVVVLLADAALRGLVREVLFARLLANGMSHEQATARLSAANDLPALERAFAEIARRPLREALERVAEGSFARDWWTLQARAGEPIGLAEAETAFRLVAESATVIAALANAVIVGQKPYHPRRVRAQAHSAA